MEEQQSTQVDTTEQQPVEQNVDSGSEFTFSDEDLAFAQWSLVLGGYMQSLLQDPARAADEFEMTARALREMLGSSEQQPEQSTQPSAPAPAPSPTPAPAQQPAASQNATPDINAIVQQAVQDAVGKMFEQMKKQALASPAGLSGRAVSSKRLADLLE